MKKGLVVNLITLILAVLTLALVGFGVWQYVAMNAYADKIIKLGEETQETDIPVELSGFAPGVSRSYDILLKSVKGENYDVEIKFDVKEGDPIGLAPFIDLEIKLEDEVVASGNLKEFLDGNIKVVFGLPFKDTRRRDLTISYIMSQNVGDDAQNTEAKFDIILHTTH